MGYGSANVRFISIIEQGYIQCLSGLKYKAKLRASLINKLVATYNMRPYDFGEATWSVLMGEKMVVSFTESQLTLFARTYDDLLELHHEIQEFTYNSDTSITYFYIKGGHLHSETVATEDTREPIFPELYPSVDIEALRASYQQSPERILILYGEPGVGKTTFLRYLLNGNFYKKVAYIKDQATLKDSELWYELTDGNYDLIIFDDLDDALSPRSKNSDTNFINNMLSYSDGIIRRDTKIVITTNQSIKEIDPALIRPGRCFDFIVLPPLSRAEALEVWSGTLKMSPELFEQRFGDAEELTQAALISEYNQILSHNIERSYMKKGDNHYTIVQKIQDLGISSDLNNRAGFNR
jgi:hypothetical protein